MLKLSMKKVYNSGPGFTGSQDLLRLAETLNKLGSMTQEIS